jgi:hypothetical protein
MHAAKSATTRPTGLECAAAAMVTNTKPKAVPGARMEQNELDLLFLQTIESIKKLSCHPRNSKRALARSSKIHSIARNTTKHHGAHKAD